MTEHDVIRDEIQQLIDCLRSLADGKEITLRESQVRDWIQILEMLDCLLANLDEKE